MKCLRIASGTALLKQLAVLCAIFIIMAGTLNLVFPLPSLYPDGPATVVVSREGALLRSFGDRQGVHRYNVTLEAVDPFYIQALLNYEDRWFYHHPGFNPVSIVRAAWQWASNGRVVSGGSTLTMQVARLIDPHERSVSGKLKQLWRALQLEWYFSKDEILTLYLNLAPFGGNIAGVEAAANRYFGTSAKHLSKNEAALLVVLPQKPSLYRPDRYPEVAKEMRNKVLARLTDSGVLPSQSASYLMQEAVQLRPADHAQLAPLLSRTLKQALPDHHVIQTTIDAGIQQRVARLLAKVKRDLPAHSSAAVLVVDNETAEVLAYQGSVDFQDDSRFSHVDMTQAVRSPGSALKPFIYGMAFDQGLIHTESLLSDIPFSFYDYKPQNLNGRFQGAVSVSQALKQSLNIPLIQVFNALGPETFDQQLNAAGITLIQDKPNLTVGLGGTGTNLMTLATLFRSLATGGEVAPLTMLKHAQPQPVTDEKNQLLSPASSWMVFNMLSSISASDRVVPRVRREIAWKTGTSYGYRDFWSVGVSPAYTVAVWVGRPDATPVVGYLGATRAAPVMFDVFDQLPEDHRRLEQPDTVKRTLICWPGGRAKAATAEERCLAQKYALTRNGITPPTLESQGHFVRQDQWPQSLSLWQQQHQIVSTAQPEAVLKIQSVREGQHYYLGQLDRIALTTNRPDAQVFWYVNHLPYRENTLSLKSYRGEVTLTACEGQTCDQRRIQVHP
ncbi:penicillin-binding protein 1C [Photobacterium sp. 1_MG-2023]|uniref:penicillin-binding protein 1C n=1 Tax=Photobacterium sp. 1_MG-2023 TaxID=3062646 RepID=UPI0026E3E633|nr:penicillin-binding protein 1C [Photobacterium sp. 1_MG-2023]MDO6705831.1 penicillin-binding protein 1C [Photobacterium sp. 1_MG-2023]